MEEKLMDAAERRYRTMVKVAMKTAYDWDIEPADIYAKRKAMGAGLEANQAGHSWAEIEEWWKEEVYAAERQREREEAENG